MSYDSKCYTLTVTVEKEDGILTVAGWQIDEQEAGAPLTITNTYRYAPYVPVIPTPTPTPQPAKPALNTADHYAYLMGYPDGTVRPDGSITRAEATTIFFRLLTEESRSQFWATANSYSDVSAGQWYNNAVSTMTSAGIVNGYPDGTFRPNAPITRAEMAKIIALFAKLDKTADRFPDTAGHWAEAYIAWAKDKGIVEGVSATEFDPEAPITREQMATIFGRYALKQGIELPKDAAPAESFPDADKISEYAREFVELMRIAGILNGYEDGTFRPQNTATRAEAAKLFSLFLSITDKLAK